MPNETEAELDKCDKDILQAKENLDAVQVRQAQLRRELLDMSETVRKAKSNLSILRTQKELLTREFWRFKHG